MPHPKELGFKDVTYLLHCGVYVLMWHGAVEYVGKSQNPFMRVGQWNTRLRFDQVFFIRCEPAELVMLEWEMIQTLKPRLNRDMVSPFELPDRMGALPRSGGTSIQVGGTSITIRKNGGGVKVEGLMVEEIRRDDPAPGWEWARP